MRSRHLPDLLASAAARWPDRRALTDRQRSVTFARLADEVAVWRTQLTASGLSPRGRAVISATSSIDTVAAMLATVAAGGIAVPVHPRLGAGQRHAIMVDARPEVVVVPGGPSAVVPYADAARPGEPADDPSRDDVALVLYTSGTTATPKGIVCPHHAVMAATQAIQSCLGYGEDDVVLCALPLAFDYGLYQVFLGLVSGAAVVLEDPDAGPGLAAALAASAATVVPLVPGIASRLVRLAARRGAPKGRAPVRLITNTGDVLGDFERAGLRATFPGAALVPMFGLTECKRVTIARPDEDLECPTGLGRALPGTAIEIVDAAGRAVPPGTTGQLLVRGPHVMAGYWRAPELTAARFCPDAVGSGTVLHTGDYGTIDGEGRFHFRGRRDDVFKLRGLRVSGTEIETAARAVPGVEAAVVLRPTSGSPAVLVVAGSVAVIDLVDHLRASIGAARIPGTCRVVDELPHTANGKIDRRALRVGSGP